MFTKAFWLATAERALRTFAQTLVALLTVDGVDLLEVDWKTSLATAGLATVLSVLTSVAASGFGAAGPSLGPESVDYEPQHRAG